MCYQVLELYSACRCLYYQHAVDRCPKYGKRGHGITQRTIPVGYACMDHSSRSGGYSSKYDSHSYAYQAAVTVSPTQTTTPDHASRNRTSEIGQGSKRKGANSDQVSRQIANKELVSQLVETLRSRSDAKNKSTAGREGKTRSKTEDIQAAGFSATEPKKPTSPSHLNSVSRQRSNSEDQISIDEPTLSDEESSSGESFASETGTIISIASSTTTVDNDATEAVFRRLLLFQDLRYLWPQLVHRCGSRKMSVLTTERLLRRYSEDLSNLATSTEDLDDSDSLICQTASRFVRRSRLNLANRIWEAHSEGKDDYTEADDERLDNNTIVDTAGGSDDMNFIYEISERFLFDTEPIIALQSSVMALVGSQHPEVYGPGYKLFRSAEVCFSNVFSLVYEPPIKPGSQRIRWKCVGSFLPIATSPEDCFHHHPPSHAVR